MKRYEHAAHFSGVAFGFAAALAAGWGAFPRPLYEDSRSRRIRHKTHAAKSATSDCMDCHTLRADGAFAGIPRTELRRLSCRADGHFAAEATLVNNYLKPNRETPWLVYARQPANVRFSHAIHVTRGQLECGRCHGAQGESDARSTRSTASAATAATSGDVPYRACTAPKTKA